MTELGRRPLLKGAGAALAGLGGLASPVGAKKGGSTARSTSLTDRGADMLVFWSEVDDDRTDPDELTDFGFPPNPASNPAPPGGLTFGGHDPADGGLFDFSRIVMRHNGDLVNTAWLILGGAVLASEPSSYKLKHLGGGMYRSRAQQMKFEARSATEIHQLLNSQLPQELPMLPIFGRLGGKTWFAVGDEYAKLGLTDGAPNPELPEWAATRIDFYEHPSMKYGLSLLYVIGADDSGSPTPTEIPEPAYRAAGGLIAGGRPVPGSR